MDNGIFGDLFDFNGDGELDAVEQAADFMAFDRLIQESDEDTDKVDADDVDSDEDDYNFDDEDDDGEDEFDSDEDDSFDDDFDSDDSDF